MKKNVIVFVLGMMMTLPASAQWTNYDTQSTIRSVFGLANAALESAERKKEMEILARQKVEFEQSFQDAMTEAKAAESAEDWEEALGKYEEAAKLNCKYSYTDQRNISRKITSLYVKAGDACRLLRLPICERESCLREQKECQRRENTACGMLQQRDAC